MNVKQVITKDEYGCATGINIEMDGDVVFSVEDFEPEDMTLSKDLSDLYNIVDMLKEAHEAGKAGRPFSVDYQTFCEE